MKIWKVFLPFIQVFFWIVLYEIINVVYPKMFSVHKTDIGWGIAGRMYFCGYALIIIALGIVAKIFDNKNIKDKTLLYVVSIVLFFCL